MEIMRSSCTKRRLSAHSLRYTLAVLLALMAPSLFAEEDDQFMIGAGFGYNEGIFEGMDGYFYPEPVLDINYGRLYASNSTLAFRFAHYRSVSFAIAATMGQIWLDTGEIKGSQEELYLGIEDRDRAIEAGLLFHYRSPVGLVEMAWYKDVSNAHDASRGLIKISRNIAETGDYISIVPGLFINYYTAKYNRYYFGISEEENIEGAALAGNTLANFNDFRPQYKPGNSGHFGFDLKVQYEISKELIATTYFAVEDLTGPWEMSSLVEDKGMASVVFGCPTAFGSQLFIWGPRPPF